ncbi:MAG: ABC transporter permease [Phycisphaeraceae bacterium]|nr:ABC transporter permease [Phycisphaeraceae bacterium]
MRQTFTIARRELTSLFFSPVAYLVLGAFGLGSTLIFLMSFYSGEPAQMRATFSAVIWLMILLVPAISMRLFAEEFRSGTIETLMTSPISDTQIVLGKWLGALGFFIALLIPLSILTIVLAFNARPDWGPIFTGFLGLIFIGGLYLAIGTFASATTQNQIIAFIITGLILLMLSVGMFFLARSTFLSSWWREIVSYLWIDNQVADFNKGVIDSSKVVYFLSGIGFFLFLAVKVLESKRWR